eukprot:scaffold34923_cov146-Isochrysis_galbana.AAC.1
MSLIICSGGVGAGCVLGPGVASVGAATGVAASRGLWPVRPLHGCWTIISRGHGGCSPPLGGLPFGPAHPWGTRTRP